MKSKFNENVSGKVSDKKPNWTKTKTARIGLKNSDLRLLQKLAQKDSVKDVGIHMTQRLADKNGRKVV